MGGAAVALMDDTPGATTVEAELVVAVMRRFEQFDALFARQEQRLVEIEEAGERYREGLQLLAHHMRVACDAVAAAAQVSEDLSRETPHAHVLPDEPPPSPRAPGTPRL